MQVLTFLAGPLLLIAGTLVWAFVVPVLQDLAWALGARIRARRHPEPIASWVRTALRPLDDGRLWLDQRPLLARQLLRETWKIHNARQWADATHRLLGSSGPIDAWNGLRAIRITLQAACAGWISESDAWALCAVVAGALQQRYEGFGPLVRDYQQAFRAWARLPLDGSGDDDECARRSRVIDQLDASGWGEPAFARDVSLSGSGSCDMASVGGLVETIRQRYVEEWSGPEQRFQQTSWPAAVRKAP